MDSYSASDRGRFPTSSIRDRVDGQPLSKTELEDDRLSAEWFESIFAKDVVEREAFAARTRGADEIFENSSRATPKQVPVVTRPKASKRKTRSSGSSTASPRKTPRLTIVLPKPKEALRRSSRSKKPRTTEGAMSIEQHDSAPESTTVDSGAEIKLTNSSIVEPETLLAVARPRRNVPRRTAATTRSSATLTSPKKPSPLGQAVTSSTLNNSSEGFGGSGSGTAVSLDSSTPKGKRISAASEDTTVDPAATKDSDGKRKRADDVEDGIAESIGKPTKESIPLRRTSRIRTPRVMGSPSHSEPSEAAGSPRKRHRKATGS